MVLDGPVLPSHSPDPVFHMGKQSLKFPAANAPDTYAAPKTARFFADFMTFPCIYYTADA